jgi:hypothetical protein
MNLKKFYGNYSSGAGAIVNNNNLDYSDYFNKAILKKYKSEINKNMKRFGFKKSDLKNKIIMNVGTGVEALSFRQFNPKHIFHYDISEFQVNRLNKYIKRKKLQKFISSSRLDLSRDKLPKNKFDFIYLHGIIQHTDHPGKTLENLIYAMKDKGKMWFFFSRAGTLIRVIGEMQRRITRFLNIDDFYLAMKTMEQALFKDNKFSDSIMDNSYVPNQNTFVPRTYLEFLKNNYIKVFGDSLLFKNNKKNVDHIQFHESVILFLEKTKSISKIKKKYVNSLSPKYVFNELDIKNYKDRNIKTIIKLFNKLEIKLKKNHQSAFAFCYNLEKLKLKYYNQFLNKKERPMVNSKFKKHYHLEIIRLLAKTLTYI